MTAKEAVICVFSNAQVMQEKTEPLCLGKFFILVDGKAISDYHDTEEDAWILAQQQTEKYILTSLTE